MIGPGGPLPAPDGMKPSTCTAENEKSSQVEENNMTVGDVDQVDNMGDVNDRNKVETGGLYTKVLLR